jgi:hypothetical protein
MACNTGRNDESLLLFQVDQSIGLLAGKRRKPLKKIAPGDNGARKR